MILKICCLYKWYRLAIVLEHVWLNDAGRHEETYINLSVKMILF